jgi:hypothetical protein
VALGTNVVFVIFPDKFVIIKFAVLFNIVNGTAEDRCAVFICTCEVEKKLLFPADGCDNAACRDELFGFLDIAKTTIYSDNAR